VFGEEHSPFPNGPPGQHFWFKPPHSGSAANAVPITADVGLLFDDFDEHAAARANTAARNRGREYRLSKRPALFIFNLRSPCSSYCFEGVVPVQLTHILMPSWFGWQVPTWHSLPPRLMLGRQHSRPGCPHASQKVFVAPIPSVQVSW
jgi:hypothetical protein